MEPRPLKTIYDTAQKVTDRMRSLAKLNSIETRFLHQRFALERFLQRLSSSPYREKIVLKGGVVMLTLANDMLRPTEDIDANIDDLSEQTVRDLVTTVASVVPDEEDGLIFRTEELTIKPIMEGGDNGLRALFWAEYPNEAGRPVRVRMKLDFAPSNPRNEYRLDSLPSTLKGFSSVAIPMYSWPRVFAEKVHTIAKHGMFNTRAKDFYDLVMLARNGRFDGEVLARALVEVFDERISPAITEPIDGLSDEFAIIQQQIWDNFTADRNGLSVKIGSLMEAIQEIRPFVLPVVSAAATGEAFRKEWTPGGGWQELAPALTP
ncbi:nucleotidyl transferase AbiEii/AbiGii toxin family protein [Thalassospira xianhensis]|uniref:Nucleotidyl transferase AbiEii/AbiGii toxin family protein n=1 Tax=Thalassospira xianhensis MCCC 1A02616 TaxID=1177929 RepID=A0A367UIV6_9PROT|nr:nucleotidyl transferase AbiEii/AbiGii toxin family protein [Thalassospira xianhensis]RCK07583.1 hypothetical protein TH5_00430 [Thalassospira xianhensis MCCC 1A02616]